MIPIATRNHWKAGLGIGFLLASCLYVLFEIAMAGSLEAYVATYDGRRHPWLLATAAVVGLPFFSWAAFRFWSRKSPPLYLVGSVLHSGQSRKAVDMKEVKSIEVSHAGRMSFRPSTLLFHMNDRSTHRVLATFWNEDVSEVAAELAKRFDIPVQDSRTGDPITGP